MVTFREWACGSISEAREAYRLRNGHLARAHVGLAMMVIGLDPGTEQSAIVVFNGAIVISHVVVGNHEALTVLSQVNHQPQVLVIEQIESFGMAVGKETFETVFWTGRFVQVWSPLWSPRRFDRMPRRTVKQHLCHTVRATDANIRQVLIDRFGPGTEKAIGKKVSPGPLFGIKSHCWAALAIAVVWYDLHGHEDPIRPGVNAEFK